MNMLEHHIERIISVKAYKEDWTKDYDDKFVRVELIVNVYGSKSNVFKVFTESKWNEVKEDGYYMG